MPENLMNMEHKANSKAYEDNYDRIFRRGKFKKDCHYLCDFGGSKEESVYCQVVHSYVKECHPACMSK